MLSLSVCMCVCVPAVCCCLVYEVVRRVAVCLGAREGSGGKCTATVREAGVHSYENARDTCERGCAKRRTEGGKGNTRTVEAKGVSEVKETDGSSRPRAAASSSKRTA